MKFFVIFKFLIIFSTVVTFANPAMIKGKITDLYTGSPIAVNIELRDTKGGKIKINSNSISGLFEQVLNSGEKYKVILSGANILREEFDYQMPDSGKYFETNVEWKAKNISVGSEIYKLKLFNVNSAEISSEGLAEIAKLKEVMKFNRAISIDISICSKDSYQNEKKVDQNKFKELTKQRIAALDALLVDWKKDRARIILSESKEELPKNSDTSVKISKIDDLFNNK